MKISNEDEVALRLKAALPKPDLSFQSALRSRLATAQPTGDRKKGLFLWTSGISVLAAALVVALLVITTVPHGPTPVSAQAILRHATLAAANPPPFNGTAETTITRVPANLPLGASGELMDRTETTSWWYQDIMHFRVDVHVLAPALQSEHQVLTSDGSSTVWFRSLTQRAFHIGIPSSSRTDVVPWLFGHFVTGGPYFVATLQTFNRVSNDSHARVVATTREFGRTVDVIRQFPAAIEYGPKGQLGHGYALWWIDDQTGIVLRYEEHVGSHGPAIQYRVTSIHFGRQASAPFRYVPSVTVRGLLPVETLLALPRQGETGFAGPSLTFRPPPPFIPVAPPAAYQLREWDRLTDQGQLDETYGVYEKASGYVVVVEQIRHGGLPAALKAEAHGKAGTCPVRFGTYSSGDQWLAFTHGRLSILIVANTLARQDLIQYVGRQACE